MRNTTLSAIFERLCTAKDYLLFSIGDSITEGARASSDETIYTAVLARDTQPSRTRSRAA